MCHEVKHTPPSFQLHYGVPVIRRAIPLALALLSTSNPQLPILDTLSKFSHDADSTVARNAVFRYEQRMTEWVWYQVVESCDHCLCM